MREAWDTIQYIATAGCRWAMLWKDFPPFTTLQNYFYRLRDIGIYIFNECWLSRRNLPPGRQRHPSAGATWVRMASMTCAL
jgi:hypothetical protein